MAKYWSKVPPWLSWARLLVIHYQQNIHLHPTIITTSMTLMSPIMSPIISPTKLLANHPLWINHPLWTNQQQKHSLWPNCWQQQWQRQWKWKQKQKWKWKQEQNQRQKWYYKLIDHLSQFVSAVPPDRFHGAFRAACVLWLRIE